MKRAYQKLVILFIIFFALLILILPVYFKLETTNDISNLQILSNISVIVSNIFVIFGVIIAIRQYLLSAKQLIENNKEQLELHKKEVYEREKDRVQKAIDLAGYYKDNILPNILIIQEIYEKTGILDIIDNISIDKMNNFDILEVTNNLSKKQIQKIEYIVKSKLFSDILVQSSINYYLGSNYISETSADMDGKEVRNIKVDEKNLKLEYARMLLQTTNNLEFFAMHFMHNTADETVVYQSLHSTYIELIRVLYYDLSSNNKNGEEKMFTNIIWLFNIWKERAIQQKQKEAEASRNNIVRGTQL